MPLEIIPVGGYGEIGRNCVAIKADDDVVILDMGLQMEKYISFTEDEDIVDLTPKKLMDIGAIPDISKIMHLKNKVKAICVTHAHLDHVGGVPYLSNKFNCDIHATPFTIEVLKTIIRDDNMAIRNELVSHDTNSSFKVSPNMKIEFINMTHSVPQTVMIAVHTKYGVVLYANDYKFDSAPVFGDKPNFARLKKLHVRVLIVDSLYAHSPIKTPSEAIAREMLKDVLLGVNSEGKAIVITTFSSHLARLKSVVEIGKMMGRKIAFVGRSLAKYVQAAENIGIVNFSKSVEIVKYGGKAKKFFSKIKNPEKYLFVVTGHQGEPKAILARMIYTGLFPFKEEDHVIFSCKTIPVDINYENRAKLEAALKQKHIRIFSDIHVSGHAAREDHRDLLHLVTPEHIIPTHGDQEMREALKDLALDMNYELDKIHLLNNGQILRLT